MLLAQGLVVLEHIGQDDHIGLGDEEDRHHHDEDHDDLAQLPPDPRLDGASADVFGIRRPRLPDLIRDLEALVGGRRHEPAQAIIAVP